MNRALLGFGCFFLALMFSTHAQAYYSQETYSPATQDYSPRQAYIPTVSAQPTQPERTIKTNPQQSQTTYSDQYMLIPITLYDEIHMTREQANRYYNLSLEAKNLFNEAMLTQLQLENMRKTYPASAIIAPTAFGAEWGVIGWGFEYDVNRTDTDTPNSSMSVDVGFGNSDTLAMDLTLGAGDIGPWFKQGIFGTKLHHTFASQTFAAAAGIANFSSWGGKQHASYYVAMTKVFYVRPTAIENNMPITATIGGGNNIYANGDSSELGEYKYDYGAFWALAWQLKPWVSLIADSSGKVYSAGASFVPFRAIPMTFTVAQYDLTQHLPEDKSSTYFQLGFVFQF